MSQPAAVRSDRTAGGAAPSSQSPIGVDYVPNEDESRVFRECNRESLLYRSLPFSAIAMAITQAMVTRGVLASSSRFGSLPKLVMAGALGYFGGKVSYTKNCQEKFKKLENSPIGEALRRAQLRHHVPDKQSEFAETNPALSSDPEPAFQTSSKSSSQAAESYSSTSADYQYDGPSAAYNPAPFSSMLSESALYSAVDDLSSPVPSFEQEEVPKKRPVLYEELRSKNRENYEVTQTQRVESIPKAQAELMPKNQVKKNKYGDSWDE